MSFVADVQTDQQRRDLFNDARVFQLAAIHGTHSRNLRCQFAGELCRVRIITADNDVTFERIIAIEQGARLCLQPQMPTGRWRRSGCYPP